MRRAPFLLAVVAALLALPASASALGLVPLASGTAWQSSPIAGASPAADQRFFVAERGGGIRIVRDGILQPTPFLVVPNVDTSGERGLSSIAFAPDYATSGLFYVFAIGHGPDEIDPAGEAGDVRVIEYRRSTSDPNLADPGSARLVFKQPHNDQAHNGGQIAFGPEGLLYVTIGDNHNAANAQDLGNDLGKVLRIDPHAAGAASYTVPPSNPFVGVAGARPEIYAWGLRNPYRASFTPAGDLVLPDVGENTWEEVNLGRATGTPAATTLAGANLGWPNCEGACPSPNPAYVDPIFAYPHDGPASSSGCAVIGGYVVRDNTLTGLAGRYLYGDTCAQELRSLDLGVPGADPRQAGASFSGGALIGFGEDGRGCTYAFTTLTVYRVAPSSTAAPSCPAAALEAPDTRRPRLKLAGAHRQRLSRALHVFARCDEACSLRASGALRFGGARASIAKPIVTRRTAAAGQRLKLAVRLRGQTLRRAKRALSLGRKVTVKVTVSARDASGNTARRSFGVKLRPSRPPRR